MDKKKAVKYAIGSMKISGFTFNKEEEELLRRLGEGEISTIDYYRTINDTLPPDAIRVKIAFTECGHHPNITERKNMPKIGDKIKCNICNKFTFVVDIVT
ncbi:antitoxin VbhA family protein [Pelosinus propionicus]|uniref:Uncharacterized protein n=1 Tax=Pelosinus propionicus DSM 13327 TaxID=1123291 RepID=A0A1I4PU58_9FIRM|nr:antitoxin VbhA family protein [Pelosinus propionicus]SFM31086.1 hypothetical protein SAMN04490355_107226 [Pelosinus propionicus DSM 13327]